MINKKALLGSVILIFLIGSLSYYFLTRPHKLDSLGEVVLGMQELDVTLALGEPDSKREVSGGTILVYNGGYSKDYDVLILNDIVSRVCTTHHGHETFGLGVYDNEKKILDKLGQPTNKSINSSGTSKIISYSDLNTAYRITEGNVEEVCVFNGLSVTFENEYGSSQPLEYRGDSEVQISSKDLISAYFSLIDSKDYYTVLKMMTERFRGSKTIDSMAEGYKYTREHIVKDINCDNENCLVNFTAIEANNNEFGIDEYVDYLMEFQIVVDQQSGIPRIDSARLITSS